jgi:maleylacetoacetate isomerase
MRLHNAARSSASYRVRIALALKGLDYEYVPLSLVKGEQFDLAFRALNPAELVPVLEHEGRRLTQSLAIVEYLEETFPAPPLLPHEPEARAYVRAMALSVACEIHPLNNLRVLRYLKQDLGLSARRFSCRLDHVPQVMRIFDACMQVPSFESARPERQPDFA